MAFLGQSAAPQRQKFTRQNSLSDQVRACRAHFAKVEFAGRAHARKRLRETELKKILRRSRARAVDVPVLFTGGGQVKAAEEVSG